MKRNLVLLILLMPLSVFTQNDLIKVNQCEKAIEKNLISEQMNNLERHINTALINDVVIREQHILSKLNKSHSLALNISRNSNARLLNIDEVETMREMILNFKIKLNKNLPHIRRK